MGEKGKKTKQLGIRLPLWMVEAIQEVADNRGFTVTDVVIELLRKELEFEGYSMGIGRTIANEKKQLDATGTDG